MVASQCCPRAPNLTERQKLACAFRILAGGGFTENIAGHITMRADAAGGHVGQPVGPVVGGDHGLGPVPGGRSTATSCEGRWDVTPAIHIHTELHRRRPDARVVIHNHPYHVTCWLRSGCCREMVHQTDVQCSPGTWPSSTSTPGEIGPPSWGAELAERIGNASVVILANHGVIVTGPTVEEATYRSATIDRQCRLMY